MKPVALILSTALAALALAACSSTTPPGPAAQAAGASHPPGPARPAGGHGREAFMGSYDANGDGVVTRAEYESVRMARFRAADKNGDGKLSEEEYVAEFEGRLRQQYADLGRQPDADFQRQIRQAHVRFGILDRNKDGFITMDEERAIMDKTFAAEDTNGDGKVDASDPLPPRRGDSN